MSKILPLTTEIAVRQYTRKLFLKNIKRILKEEGEVIIDLDKKAKEVHKKIKEVDEIIKKHGTDIAIANYLIVARAEMLPLLDRINWCLSYPVYDHAFMELLGLLYGLIANDEEDLRYTRAMMSIFSERNEDITEFLSNTINPLDPLNWAMWAGILAAPFTGTSSLTLTGYAVAAKGLKAAAEEGGEAAVKRLLQRKASQQIMKSNPDAMAGKVVKSQAGKMSSAGSRKAGRFNIKKKLANMLADSDLDPDQMKTLSTKLKNIFPSSQTKADGFLAIDGYVTDIFTNNASIKNMIADALKAGDATTLKKASKEVSELLADETDNIIDKIVESMPDVADDVKALFKTELKNNDAFKANLNNYVKIQSDLVLAEFKVTSQSVNILMGGLGFVSGQSARSIRNWILDKNATLLSRAGRESLDTLSRGSAKSALIDFVAGNKDFLKTALQDFKISEIIDLTRQLKSKFPNGLGQYGEAFLTAMRNVGANAGEDAYKTAIKNSLGVDATIANKIFDVMKTINLSSPGVGLTYTNKLLKSMLDFEDAVSDLTEEILINQAKKGTAKNASRSLFKELEILLWVKAGQEIFGDGRSAFDAFASPPDTKTGQSTQNDDISIKVEELTSKQKEEAKAMGMELEEYATELAESSSGDEGELIDDESELKSLVSKSSDTFYSGYEDGFDAGDIVAALNQYDSYLLNFTNAGNEISRLAKYWNDHSWQKELAYDISKVSFAWGGGYRDLEWSGDNKLGLQQDMQSFADAKTLNKLVNKLSSIMDSAVGKSTSKSALTSSFESLAGLKGIQDTSGFKAILKAGKSSDLTNFSATSKKNMNSVYAQIGAVSQEKSNAVDENKSLRISQKHLRKIVHKHILNEIKNAINKKKNIIYEINGNDLTFDDLSSKVFSVFQDLNTGMKDLKPLFKPTVKNWLAMNTEGEVFFNIAALGSDRKLNFKNIRTAALTNILKKLNDNNPITESNAKLRILKNGHKYIEDVTSKTKESKFQIIFAYLKKSDISTLNNLTITEFKIHNYDLKTSEINDIFKTGAELDITSSPMIKGLGFTKKEAGEQSITWSKEKYDASLKEKLKKSKILKVWREDDLELNILGENLKGLANNAKNNNGASSNTSFNPYDGKSFIVPFLSFVSSDTEVSELSNSNFIDYLGENKSIESFNVTIPDFLSDVGITSKKYLEGYNDDELRRGTKGKNVFMMPISDSDYKEADSNFKDLISAIKANNENFYNSLAADEKKAILDSDVESAEVADATSGGDSSETSTNSVKPKELRKKQQQWVVNMTGNDKNVDIVDNSPGSDSRSNIFIYEMSLAFYLYKWGLQEEIKSTAPTFYEGMWTSGYGKNHKINLTLGDVPPGEYQAIEEIVTKHAQNKSQGVYRDSDIKNLAGINPMGSIRWEEYSRQIIQAKPEYSGYDVDNEPGKVYSSALFFKDLVNNTFPPSGSGLGQRKSSKRKGSGNTGKGKGSSSGNKGTKKSSGNRNLSRDNNPVSDQSSRIVIQQETSGGLLYSGIYTKEQIEEIMTDASPKSAVYDSKTTAKIKLNFDNNGMLKQVKKVSSNKNIGDVISTADNSLINNKVSQWIKAVEKSLKNKLSLDKSAIPGLSTLPKVITVTIKNSNTLNRRTVSESRKRKNVRVSKAFKKKLR